VNKDFYFNMLRFSEVVTGPKMGNYKWPLSQVLRQIYRWLLEAKLAGTFFLGLLIVPVGLSFWPRENTLRITGCILRAAGMALAIRVLLGVRIHFDLPEVREIARLWWKRRPKWTNNIVITVPSVEMRLRGVMNGTSRSGLRISPSKL
jgi:hypothetical protein